MKGNLENVMFEKQIQQDTKRALEFFLARFWVQKKAFNGIIRIRNDFKS